MIGSFMIWFQPFLRKVAADEMGSFGLRGDAGAFFIGIDIESDVFDLEGFTPR